jgi:hypothetical protein
MTFGIGQPALQAHLHAGSRRLSCRDSDVRFGEGRPPQSWALKWLQTHSLSTPPPLEGLRKAGLPEE